MDEHLNDDQIDEYLRLASRGNSESTIQFTSWEEGHAHLKSCEDCRSRMQAQEKATDRLAQLKIQGGGTCGPDCPSPDVWDELAAGISIGEREKYLRHAASCDYCGPLLSRASADFNVELTAEEENLIAGLRSSSQSWQSQVAAKLSRKGQKRASVFRLFQFRTLILSSASALVLIGAALFIGRTWLWPSPEALLARAYSEDRTLEVRIAGADAAPLRIERGAGRSLITQNPTLIQAEAVISRELPRHPGDAYWLRMKARADLLDWNYSQAIISLTQAQSVRADDPQLLTDLASAYFERAEAIHNQDDYGKAEELLSTVLEKNPRDETALFNRALVYERLFLYSQSLNDWKRYIELFPAGKWTTEAQTHLQDVQRKIEAKQRSLAEPLMAPAAIVEAAASRGDFAKQIDPRIEEYLDAALRDWLPRAFGDGRSGNTQKTRTTLRKAIEILAQETLQRHQDPFLKDLLAGSVNSAFQSAATNLSLAIEDNHLSRHEEALAEARESEKAFRHIAVLPGALRAEFEQAYGAQISLHGEDCLRAATTVADKAHERGYLWLEAQSRIEEAFCSNLVGRVGDAANESLQATEVSRRGGYYESYLRATVGAAATEWESGDVARAWTLIHQGLGDYWNGRGSKARGLALYAVIDAMAEYSLQGRLQSAVIREYLPLVDEHRDPVQSVLSWYRLGNSELLNGHDAEAGAAFRKAQSILESAPHGVATRDRRVLGIVGLAKVELLKGDTEASYKLLHSIEDSIPQVQESFGVMDFYETLGETEESAGRTREAADAFESAIRVSERAVESLKSPQDRLSWSYNFAPAYRSLVHLKLKEGDATGALALWERYRALALCAGQSASLPEKLGRGFAEGNEPALGGAQAGSQLAVVGAPMPKRNRIVYAQIGNYIAAWVQGRNGLSVLWLAVDATELGRAIEQFVAECSDPASDLTLLERHSRVLYQWLIAPCAQFLSDEPEVTIEPDGEIERLPMEALIDPHGGYFGAGHVVVFSPGMAYDNVSRANANIGRYFRVAVLKGGVSDTTKGFLPDQSSLEEVDEIAALFPRTTVLDSKSLANGILRRALAQAQIFHFSGHAQSDSGNVGLLMGTAGAEGGGTVLHAGDIYRMTFPVCRLAVLAGCSTSLGSSGRWNDRDGLVLPFLNSGVPCVVASRWEVDSEATTELVRWFYQKLLTGASEVEAIRSAKQKMRAGTNTAHPYYWASFDLYGPCGTKS